MPNENQKITIKTKEKFDIDVILESGSMSLKDLRLGDCEVFVDVLPGTTVASIKVDVSFIGTYVP